jgi:hypothetical protein
VTLVSIDRFLEDASLGARVLERAGYGDVTPAPIEAGVDRALWDRPVPVRWRLYHAAMRWTSRLIGTRLGPDRAVLVDHTTWMRRLHAASLNGYEAVGERSE